MDIHAPTPEQLDALPRAIVLAGPTAAGKTNLSLAIARAIGGEIVNMDSVQIYRGLDIGSAKISLEEREDIPHHLIDLLEPDEDHNVGDFRTRALAAIASIHARKKEAIIVGGTGLYLRVLVHGLLDAPPPSDVIRARHNEISRTEGIHALYEALERVDPELAATLHARDKVRLSRGLEVFEQTGKKLSVLQREHRFRVPNLNVLKLALWRPREELYARINARVDQMMSQGLFEECEALFARYSRECNVFSSLGYRQMAEHIFDGVPLDEAVASIKQKTRRYAKQQLSWLRSEPDVHWLRAPVLDESGELPGALHEDITRFLRENTPPAASWASSKDETLAIKKRRRR